MIGTDDERWHDDSDGERELRPWWIRIPLNAVAVAVVVIASWGLVDGCVRLLRLLPYAQ